MEAQRISLSQMHAAQLELLQEETEARTHSLELRLQQKSSHRDPGGEIRRYVSTGFVNFKFNSFMKLFI